MLKNGLRCGGLICSKNILKVDSLFFRPLLVCERRAVLIAVVDAGFGSDNQ